MYVWVSFHLSYDPYVHIFMGYSLGVSLFLPYGKNFITKLPHGKNVNKYGNLVVRIYWVSTSVC